MRDYWLYLLFKDSTGQQVVDSATGYEINNKPNGRSELILTLDANLLLKNKENQDDMPVYYFEENREELLEEEDRSDDFEIKDFIKTVYINESKRTVTVVLKNGSIGISRCHDTDTFDTHIGFCVALAYALFPSRTATIKYVDGCVEKNKAKATARAEASAKKVAKRSTQATVSEK